MDSDASEHHYNGNSRTNFRNHFAVPINIDSTRYEVALTEIGYVYNAPFIPKGTRLFSTILANTEESTTRLIEYPEVFDIEGPNESTHSYTANLEEYEYAKQHSMHLESAKQHYAESELPKTSNHIILLHFTMDVLATKKITSIDELLEDLNKTLKPTNITFEKLENRVTIRHKTPHIIVKQHLDYSSKIKSYFSLTEDKDEDEFGYSDGEYYHDCLLSGEPVQIAESEKLMTLSFYKGEIPILSASVNAEQIPRGTTLIGYAGEDIYNIQDLTKEITNAKPKML
ncbi:unnamed protein product [Orchesella dallaii]|uniref:Uncharacterized protein n=1 Tax=Orchesella dallaii TaxID=48710 RepID=A0ABP1RZZ9_9HEXA